MRIIPNRKEDTFLVSVTNFGIGIEPDEVSHLFTVNYRSQRAETVAKGSGLGLSIARAIMRKHGGDLVLTAPKDPTIFSAVFPKKLMLGPYKI